MLTIVGVGPGNPKYLTVEALEVIKHGKYILAFERVGNALKHINKNIITIKKVDECLGHLGNDEEIILLASGDPNFFGIVDYIKRKGIDIGKVIPGLSSFQYLMSKLQMSWEDAKFLSLHGREDALEDIREYPLSIILTDKKHNPEYISKKLKDMGIKGKIYVGFNLSHKDEIIIEKNIGEEIEDISSLAVVVIQNDMD